MHRNPNLPPDALPAFLLLTQEQRRAAWGRYDLANGKTSNAGKAPAMKTATTETNSAQVKKLRIARATKGPKPIGQRRQEDAATIVAAAKVAKAPKLGTVVSVQTSEPGKAPELIVTAKLTDEGIALLSPKPAATAAETPKETKTMKRTAALKNPKPNAKNKAVAPAQRKAPAAAKRKAATSARSPAGNAPASAKPKTKADTIQDMLTAAGGTTRKALSEATGYPHVNLKMAAERAGMKLVEKDGVVWLEAKK